MSKEITLEVDRTYEKKINQRIEELHGEKVEAMRAGWGDRQAEKVENALERMSEAEYVSYLVKEDLKRAGYIDE